MQRFIYVTLLGLLTLVWRLSACAAEPPAPAPPATNPVCAAVLDAEILADLPAPDRKALTGAVDMLLTESLAGRKEFVMVERQALDKLLAEKALAASGLVKVPAGEVAESLRPFWSAGVLICPVVREVKAAGDSRPDKSRVLAIEVEAVLAQTGQSLGETAAAGTWRNGAWEKPPVLDAPLKALWADLPHNFQQVRVSRLIEIADVRLTSSLRRLQWMADDLGDVLRNSLALPGVTLLRPRHPISTREERLLRVMGLAAPTGKDPSAELMCSPDLRLDTELTEEVGKDLDYDKTHISATLSLRGREGPPMQKTFSGKASQYAALAADASAWLNAQLVPAGSTGGEALDQEYSKQVAQRELATARQLAKACGWYGSLWWNRATPAQALRSKALDHAMRASHLDPANEEAARLVALGIDSPYWLRGDGRSTVCSDRVIAEGQRYLDRFGKDPHADDVRGRVGQTAVDRLDQIGLDRLGMIQGDYGWIGLEYSPEIHRLAKAALVTMDRDVAVEKFRSFLWRDANIVGECILGHCQLDQLEEERTSWREYWKRNVETLGGDFPPWDYIDMSYCIRTKDSASLRSLLTVLARRYPRSYASVWEGTAMTLEHKPAWKVRLSRFLKLAGDPDWETWEPAFGVETFEWNSNDFYHFLTRFNPPMPGAWDEKDALPLPAARITLEYDRSAAPKDQNKGARPMLSAGGFMWLCRPAPGEDLTTHRSLLLVPMQSVTAADQSSAKAEGLEWPAHPSDGRREAPGKAVRCWLATTEAGMPTVWIGTASHGLARFDLKGGQWRGRWYAAREGIPAEDILTVLPCLYRGKPKLLILSQTPRLQPAPQSPIFLWVLDPADDGMTTIMTGNWVTGWIAFTRAPFYMRLVATWKDGNRIPLCLYNRDDFPDRDAAEITSLEYGPNAELRRNYIFVLARDEAKMRVWSASDGTLKEFDGKRSLPRLREQAPRADDIFFTSPDALKHGRAHFAVSFGSNLWHMPRSPIVDIECTTSFPATLWGSVANPATPFDMANNLVAAYQPAERAPLEENDAWYGPWKTGLSLQSLDLIGDCLWASTSTGELYRFTPSGLLNAAEKQGSVRSTAQWLRQYRARLESSWLNAVRMHISDAEFDKAIAAINAARQSPQAKASQASLDLWEALARARNGDLATAERLYRQLSDDPKVEPFVRGIALVSLVNVRHAAADWAGVDQALDRLISMFPSLDQQAFGMKETIDWFREEARKGRSASNSAVAPAAATTAASTDR